MQKGRIQQFPKRYIDIKCQTLGSGNNLVTANQYSVLAKKSLEEYSVTSPHIEKIEFSPDKKYLRVFIKEKSRNSAPIIRTIADYLRGCQARLVENSYFFNKSKKEENEEKKEKNLYFGEYIPPNDNISKTFQSKL